MQKSSLHASEKNKNINLALTALTLACDLIRPGPASVSQNLDRTS
jgi:hypothetical protein